MQTYTAKSPLHHDGKRYEVGALVGLSDEVAEPLLRMGCVAAAAGDDLANEGSPTGAKAAKAKGKGKGK